MSRHATGRQRRSRDPRLGGGAAGAGYPPPVDWIEVAIDKPWLSVSDIAGYMDVSPYVVGHVIREGELPAVKFGREWRVARHDFEAWLNRRRGATA